MLRRTGVFLCTAYVSWALSVNVMLNLAGVTCQNGLHWYDWNKNWSEIQINSKRFLRSRPVKTKPPKTILLQKSTIKRTESVIFMPTDRHVPVCASSLYQMADSDCVWCAAHWCTRHDIQQVLSHLKASKCNALLYWESKKINKIK